MNNRPNLSCLETPHSNPSDSPPSIIDSNSFLADSTRLPLRSLLLIAQSPVLIVAPHPDDETLGCGGAIARLRRLGCDVQVLVVSDGTRSHPNSRKYPPPALQALRQQETLTALAALGVNTATFLGLKDGAIPTAQSPGIQEAVAACCGVLQKVRPAIVFLPWRFDPHPDHRATWNLMQTALQSFNGSPRLIEYPIWDWDSTQRQQTQNLAQISGWRLNIESVIQHKQTAIAAYRSQTTNLIDDDPDGFCLTPEMLSNFTRLWEVYFEEVQ
ncbi:PIG-L deacetylase family protein [Phormidesmis priestleyi]